VRGGIGFAIGSAVGVLGSLLIVKKIEGDMSCFLLTKEECAVAKPQPLTITPKTGLRIAMVAAVTGAVGATIGAFKEEC
jgi:hypothetical protein